LLAGALLCRLFFNISSVGKDKIMLACDWRMAQINLTPDSQAKTAKEVRSFGL
jgi:hypothetical protein